ncbi:MAG: ATP-binding cassette domain-containing protein [bacterium]|nr:ATP-binding cassette domain-containing protein [bacterium]
MSQKPIITVKNLVKKYKKADFNAVDNISFDVFPGEFFAFLGPNGAGKTTTISILTTTLSKTSGDIKVADLDTERQASLVRRKIGIIFQNPSLDQNLTAEENIRLHAILYGLYPFRPGFSFMPEAYKKQVSELAHVLGIEEQIFKPVKTLSGGMKRKMEIIRSLMHKPKILFLDEPTSGLDPISRRDLWQYLNEIRKKESTTIFLTTHYLEEAEGADRVCIINKGKIVALGTPQEIKKSWVGPNHTLEEAYFEVIENSE